MTVPDGAGMHLHFTVPGKPRAKQRPRFNPKTGRMYTPKGTKVYEDAIKEAFTPLITDEVRSTLAGFRGKVLMDIVVYHGVPKSWKKDIRDRCLANQVACVAKPDFNNVAKSVEDALNGLAYHDDSCVVPGPNCDKLYAQDPRIEVTLWYSSEPCDQEEGGGHDDNPRWNPVWVDA